MVRAVSCEARGPVFNSSSDQMFFSLLGYKEVGMMNCMILRIHVENKIILSHAIRGELV